MPVTEDEFRAALSRFASGVTVVTTKDSRGTLHGITVSAFCSVSLEPPLVLICIEQIAGSHAALIESRVFVVNFLSSQQLDLSERFASEAADRFEGVEFKLNIDGLPIIAGCIAVLECRVKQTCAGGDHTVFIAEVESAEVYSGDPLVYFRSDYRALSA